MLQTIMLQKASQRPIPIMEELISESHFGKTGLQHQGAIQSQTERGKPQQGVRMLSLLKKRVPQPDYMPPTLLIRST